MKHAQNYLIRKIATIGSREELDGFLSEGRRQQYKYSTEEQRAIDEKRVELMRGKR